MKTKSLLRAAAIVLYLISVVSAQDLTGSRIEILSILSSPTKAAENKKSSQLKGIQSLGGGTGIAYTADALFRTDNGGASWREVEVRRSLSETLSTVVFESASTGFAVVVNRNTPQASLARTIDGGATWQRSPIGLRSEDVSDTDFENSILEINGDFLTLAFRTETGSNFIGSLRYISTDGGETWGFDSRSSELRTSDAAEQKRSGGWTLASEGTCVGFKTGCVEETRILSSGKDITPPQVREMARLEKEYARAEAVRTQMYAAPGGSTRISLNLGFDKCTAATLAQMQTWWETSPFYDANIYMSGRNRACTQPQLTAAWVDQVSAMGWGLIPTVLGYQSPCTSSTTTAKLSYDAAVAETQGRGEADIAVADAVNLGLTRGSILYYDMERYDETAATPGCRTATAAFLKGWTDRLKELGYKSGTYGSPKNAQEDWVNLPPASRMDAIWMARWDNVPSVWTYQTFPNFPNNVWNNHQRIKQWQSPHNETWGGVTFNIDGNIADGPVAGPAIAKNKTADFDGDGKTDVSVFRPDTGQWFISGTLGPTYSVYEFGIASDILAPGDYDGDGKTDLAVFRPTNGTWYLRTKGGQFIVRPFGADGDIPVPADYNGDGKTDIAVFRPSNVTWYIAGSDSLGSFSVVQFGVNGDRPARGDYDGDGKDDIAVWRPSTGFWYVLASSGRFFGVQWGISTDSPVQADYDGDGKTDFAVVRGSTWFIAGTRDGFRVLDFGTGDDIPAAGDFDGDARYDIAVFRPSNGNWYLLQSQAGYVVRGFGIRNDRPIPKAYLPQ